MSNYELPNAMRLSRTANRIKRDRELARLQRRARIKGRRSRQRVPHCKPNEPPSSGNSSSGNEIPF